MSSILSSIMSDEKICFNLPNEGEMTSCETFAASDSGNCRGKRRMSEHLYLKSYQSNDLTKIFQKFVKSHGNFETCAKTLDSDILKTVPESVRNFFLLYIKQVNAINELYKCLEHLLENSNSLFDGTKIIDQVHRVSNDSISGLQVLTDAIIQELSNTCVNFPAVSPRFVEPAVKLRRFESAFKFESTEGSVDESKPPFEDEDIDFAGSDIELQLEEIVDKANESESAAAQSSAYKGNSEIASRHKSLPCGSQKPTDDEKSYNLNYDPDGFVRVFVDGACPSNGRANAKAGIGVWFGDGSPLNVSEPATGLPTNNNAEIQAATQAILKANSVGVKKLRLYTDSQFVINCMTKWIFGWKRKNWTNSSNKPVINKISLMALDKVIPLMDAVDWKYVEGHKGILGNERADFLAKNGVHNL